MRTLVHTRQKWPQHAAESHHDDREPNHEGDGDCCGYACHVEHHQSVAAVARVSAYTRV